MRQPSCLHDNKVLHHSEHRVGTSETEEADKEKTDEKYELGHNGLTQEFTIKEACTDGEQEDVERCQLEDAYGYRYHKGYPQET